MNCCINLEAWVCFIEYLPLNFMMVVYHIHFNLLHISVCVCVFLQFQTFPTSTSHSKTVYSTSNLKTPMKPGAGSKPHDVQEALKKKQVLCYMLTTV